MQKRSLFCMLGVLTLAACNAQTVREDEAIARARKPIVAGSQANPEQLWSTVALVDGQQVACSGVLIAPTVVLTAAHCVMTFDTDEERFTAIIDPSSRRVLTNTLSASSQQSEQHDIESIEVASFDGSIRPDAGDNPERLGQANDIALLHITPAATEQAFTPLLPVEDVETLLIEGRALTIAGFGATSNALDNKTEGRLHVGTTTLTRRNNFEFIAGDPGSSDACHGDSGGPAYLEEQGRPYVVGLTSRGIENAGDDCGQGTIWTLGPAYTDWVVKAADGAYPHTPAPEPEPAPGAPSGDCAVAHAGASVTPVSLWLWSLLFVGLMLRRKRGAATPAH